MRFVAFVAGIIGFSAIAASAAEEERLMLVFTSKTQHLEADYTYAPGTSEEATIPISLDRKFNWQYLDAVVDPKNPNEMAADSNAMITEVLYQDVEQAIAAAQKEALKRKIDVKHVLPKYLKDLRQDQIDCRKVARRMVESLMGNRVKLKERSDGSLHHRYQLRGDHLDSLLVARQLHTITISRDSSITATDKDPRFVCTATKVGKDDASCGSLNIKFNPLTAQGGVFQGKKVLVFNPNECVKQLDDMTFESCELMAQVQRCGMKYTQKAEGARAGSPSTWGLADQLQKAANAEMRARQEGRYLPGAKKPKTVAADDDQQESSSPIDPTFYDRFKKPSGNPAF